MTDEEMLVGLKHIGKRVSLPCPDGLEGCLVHHFGIETDPVAARAIDRIKALTAEIERLRLKLEQASNNLKAGAKRYECLGLALSARLAFEALEKQP